MTTNKRITIPYEYRNAPVPGGGFVTGFCFHPRERNILYARTDIGGVYRYDFSRRTWKSLMDHVKAIEKWESYSLSAPIGTTRLLYIARGDWEQNYFAALKTVVKILNTFLSHCIHGNAPGRGTGETYG